MAKQKKKKKHASGRVVKMAEKQTQNLNNIASKIGPGTKYKERLRTAYISIVLYFGMLYLAYKWYLSNPEMAFSLLMAGIIIAIYNIVKAVMSIRDNEYSTQNKFLIIINALFIFIFLGWAII